MGLPVISTCDLPLLLWATEIQIITLFSPAASNIKMAVMSPGGQILETLVVKESRLDLAANEEFSWFLSREGQG